MAVRQSPYETQVPTVLFLQVARLLLPIHTNNRYRCNNVRHPLPVHNQPQSNKEVAHLQVMFPLQEITRLVKVSLLQDMAPAMLHLLVARQRVIVQVQQASHLDTRLQALRDNPRTPESADHQVTESDPLKFHRSNQQLKDNSEDSKQINYLRCVASGIPPNLSHNMSRIVFFLFMVFFVVKLFLGLESV